MAEYVKGLHEIGDGVFAYLQPDGSWGYSNAGFVAGAESGLLVDTLFDLRHTGEMLEEIRRRSGAGERIGTVVNTHANGDHCYGNQLVEGAEIVATAACAEEMREAPPERLAGLLDAAPQLGELGSYLNRIFGAFEFHGITLTTPTRTFEGELTLHVGDREVRLIEVGPAHTAGDLIAYLPADRVLFAGDILFIGGHPVMWAGPVENWIAALDRIAGLDADTIVPGHGPVTDRSGVADLRAYFEHLRSEARQRFEAGMAPLEAARDIPMEAYAEWGESERVVANVIGLYRQWGAEVQSDAATLFTQMAELAG